MNIYLQEALAREKAKGSFEEYRRYISEEYQDWSYVGLVNDHLQKVYDGDIRRLMVFMGPQHGKTKAVSEDFASYWIGNRPKTSVIGTAYNYDRAMDYGRDVRARVRSPEFKAIFPDVSMNPDSTAADRWSVMNGGGYYAAGVGTALTGRRGDLMVIDDPFSGPEDANSELSRERVWKWYNTVFRTRLSPGGAIVLVMTRWHDDDLAGRLLEKQGDRWAVLEIKTEAEEDDILGREAGQYLCDAPGGSRYSQEDYDEMRQDMPPYDWSALHQQNPVPTEGLFFQKNWFPRYDVVPENATYYVTADLSYAGKETSDYAVIMAWAIDHEANWYCVDMWRDKATPDVIADQMVSFLEQYKPYEAVLEKVDDNFGGAIIRSRMDERRIFCNLATVSAAGNKSAKATNYRGRMARGKVLWPDKPWVEDVIHEHLRFPNGKNDDIVDNGSVLGRHLDNISTPKFIKPAQRIGTDTGQALIDSILESASKPMSRYG